MVIDVCLYTVASKDQPSGELADGGVGGNRGDTCYQPVGVEMHDIPSLPHCRHHRVGWGKWQLFRRVLHPSVIIMPMYEVPNNSNVQGVLSAHTWLYYTIIVYTSFSYITI